VFYGVLVGRNRRPRQDVDAVLSHTNVSCIRSTRTNLFSILSKTITYPLSRDPQPLCSYCCLGKAFKCVNAMKRLSLHDAALGLPDLGLSVTDPVVAYRVFRLYIVCQEHSK
jgi:hypothetical protein